MPSPLSTVLLRAVSFPFHFRSLFHYPKKDPSHCFHGSVHRIADPDLRRSADHNLAQDIAMHKRNEERNGAVQFTNERRSAGIRSSPASFAGGEGKLAGGEVAEGDLWEGRRKEVGSLHKDQYDTEELKDDINGETKKLFHQQERVSYSRLFTLPTALTLGRVAAVPLLVSTFHMNGSWSTTTTTGIFLIAAFTDWLDGYLARKMRLGTIFGAFLDPVADKLMVAATLVLLCTKPLELAFFGVVPWILTIPAIAIIGREITMSAVREWAASQNSRVLEAVAVNNLGKWKTATQMVALSILLLARDPSLTGPGFLVSIGVFLLYVSAGLALWSLAVYMRKIWRFMIM